MAAEVVMPRLGMTMTEGTVAEWLVSDGGTVEIGDPVFRLETEKIEFQVEAEAAGTVSHSVPAGTVVAPGTTVGFILAEGESMPATGVARPAGSEPAPASPPGANRRASSPAPVEVGEPSEARASPAARRLAQEKGVDLKGVTGSGPGGRIVELDVIAAAAQTPRPAPSRSSGGEPAPASPIARRLAAELEIDLRTVTGTGPGGRITKEDVEAAASAPPAPAASSPAPAASSPAPAPGALIPLRGMRGVIADRMHASLQEMAQLTMGMEVAMDGAASMRQQLIAEWEGVGIRPSFTDLVIRAVARALEQHPGLNAEVTEQGIELRPEVNIGMAVALGDGLVVPVIRNAPALSLRELAGESSRLAEAAREGTLGLDDYAGGTFSVTSLGMADVDFFTPIINPPNVAILGIGRIRDGIRWEDTSPVRTRLLTLSLTIDHRAVDGVPGAAFLRDVRDLLEAPYRLLL